MNNVKIHITLIGNLKNVIIVVLNFSGIIWDFKEDINGNNIPDNPSK